MNGRFAVGKNLTRMNVSKPKVVVTDFSFPDLSTEEQILSAAGCEFSGRQCRAEAELVELCQEADAVITQYAPITSAVIGAMTRAVAIVRYGIGVDNVDLEAARARGIPVCNVPDYCIDEVADHTLAFILAATRQVVSHTSHLRAGNWGLAVPLSAMKTLRQMTLGVVGFGRIGRAVTRRLAPFNCKLLVADPAVAPPEIERLGARPAPLDELLRNADLITLHCPSTPQTRKLVNRDTLARLKPGSILINVGRGDLVDTPALVEALEAGRLGAAALDVFDPEPIPANHPVLKMPNVILTPHVASASPTAMKKLRETAATLALMAVRGEALPNIVNGVKPRA
jgi:D-3-phosphoglycerate dehydrogenase